MNLMFILVKGGIFIFSEKKEPEIIPMDVVNSSVCLYSTNI